MCRARSALPPTTAPRPPTPPTAPPPPTTREPERSGPGSLTRTASGDVADLDARLSGGWTNPFGAFPGGGGQRERARAFAEYIRGAKSASAIAAAAGLPLLKGYEARARLERRLRAMLAVAARIRMGEHLTICCGCSPRGPCTCHAQVIVGWVRDRSGTT